MVKVHVVLRDENGMVLRGVWSSGSTARTAVKAGVDKAMRFSAMKPGWRKLTIDVERES